MLTRSPYFRQIMYASPLCMHEDLSGRGLFFTVLALCDIVQRDSISVGDNLVCTNQDGGFHSAMLCKLTVFQRVTILCLQAKMEEFFTVLVLCHTVRVDNISGGDAAAGASTVYSATGEDYEYQAASPDEKALVEACRR